MSADPAWVDWRVAGLSSGHRVLRRGQRGPCRRTARFAPGVCRWRIHVALWSRGHVRAQRPPGDCATESARSLVFRLGSHVKFDHRCVLSHVVARRSNTPGILRFSRLVGQAPRRSPCEHDFRDGTLASGCLPLVCTPRSGCWSAVLRLRPVQIRGSRDRVWRCTRGLPDASSRVSRARSRDGRSDRCLSRHRSRLYATTSLRIRTRPKGARSGTESCSRRPDHDTRAGRLAVDDTSGVGCSVSDHRPARRLVGCSRPVHRWVDCRRRPGGRSVRESTGWRPRSHRRLH